MDYRTVIESKYKRESWEELLHDIFKAGASFRATPIPVNANSPLAVSSLQLGTITLADDNKIAVYEIKLSDHVDIIANRVGIRNLLHNDWKFKGCVGAFMFCYRDNESVLRFSYVSSTYKFNEAGLMERDETDTKRFTYLLGAGHRSRTAIKQFEDLKNSKLHLADLTKAFSLEALSDRFFKDYKRIYEDIIEYVTGKRIIKIANKWEEKTTCSPNTAIMAEFSKFADPEKAVRDYVKNLMGRIVFLQFIQKKGWLGVPCDKEWGNGDKEFLQNLYERSNKENFIDEVLEVLFTDINTKRENDIASSILGKDIKIPYLNGGLFQRDKADNCTFRLPKKLLDEMFKFFSSYNFTIDENDPEDAEIGVDPEMLGRIFENLLEDNKDKGAFYTPKEIVQYMCRESLIAYLTTGKSDEEKKAIRSFVLTYNHNVLWDSLKTDIDEKLKSVKICDPAIGSGAFPMGLLKELYACRSALEDLNDDNAADIKKHIIQNSIYGVDIEKGAVDIARLRFWLSIIVDEKTPHALPNMDFKIMQGNSLIPTFNGKYVNLTDKLRHVNSSKIREAKKRLLTLQEEFYSAEGNYKLELLVQIKLQILEIVKLQMDYEYQQEVEDSAVTMNLFNPNPLKEVKIDEEKLRIVGMCLNLQRDLKSPSKSLEDKAAVVIPFFDWKIMFSDVFSANDGNGRFDIVIANPPYIDSESMVNQGMSFLRDHLKKQYKTLSGNWDIYMAFMAFGLSIANYCVFITPDKWLSKPFGQKFREVVLRDNTIFVTRAGNNIFENATVDAIISMFSQAKPKELEAYQYTESKDVRYLTSINTSILRDPVLIDYLFTEHREVIEHLDSFPNKISDYAQCEGACATSDAYNLKPYIYNNATPNFEDEYIVINTGTISKYAHRWGLKQFTYLGDKYDYPTVKRQAFESNFGKTYIRRSASKKIVFKGLNLLDACLDLDGKILPGKSTMTLCSSDTYLLKFLCGILNSSLAIFYIKSKYLSSSYCGGITFTSEMIDYFPMPDIDESTKDFVVSLVDEILVNTEADPC